MDKLKKSKDTNLSWVYPPNNWVSSHDKTFVYGWSNPKAKLSVACKNSLKEAGSRKQETRIKIYPNGNFAQSIKLPAEKNIIQLIQSLNGRKKVTTRLVIAKKQKEPINKSYKGKGPHHRVTPHHYINPKNLVIIIDPGHGGREYGTHSPKGIPEKVFNLQVARLLFNKLKKIYKNVYLTRSKDKFLSLNQRVNFARRKKCNLLLSIHHNALPDYENPLKHKGVGIYYTHDFNRSFAKLLLKSISKEAILKKYGIFKRNFALTKPDFCTSVLIECGFLIHPREAAYITKKIIQKKIVSGIVKGICDGLNTHCI